MNEGLREEHASGDVANEPAAPCKCGQGLDNAIPIFLIVFIVVMVIERLITKRALRRKAKIGSDEVNG